MTTDDPTTRASYPHLFRPTRIGARTARNAFKYEGVVTNFAHPDGSVSPRELAYQRVVAASGAGIITHQGAYPDEAGLGKAYARQISIADDRFVEGLAEVARILHDGGAIAIQQILHGGRYGGIDADHCLQSSDVAQALPNLRPPRRMNTTDIEQSIEQHVQAARRAIAAGFDGVELPAVSGYLVSTFLSSFTNDRDDEYGGSLENRGRFLLDLVKRIKQEIQEKILWVRLSGDELLDEVGGSRPDECIEFMRMVEQAGVDGVSIGVGWPESQSSVLGRDLPSDRWLYLAESAKQAITVPIAFGPLLSHAIQAEDALASGAMDLWEVGRPFLADPDLLEKAAEGREREIRPCMGGLTCRARVSAGLPVTCSVNPRLGHEVDPAYTPRPASVTKRVLVIGGGPAGMECGLVAAHRGHDVTLVERLSFLGGQTRQASMEINSGGQVFTELARSYERQLQVAGAQVRLSTQATVELVREFAPDVAVVATGATFGRLDVPGSDLEIVLYGEWIRPEQVPEGQRIVVLGAERQALVLAERFADAGRFVVIVGEAAGAEEVPGFEASHAGWLAEHGVQVVWGAKVERIAERGVFVERDGRRVFLHADHVVAAGPRESVNELTIELEPWVDELYTAGDAVLPRTVASAIQEGFRIGTTI